MLHMAPGGRDARCVYDQTSRIYSVYTVYGIQEVYKINWALGWVRLMAVPSLFRFCEISQGSPS